MLAYTHPLVINLKDTWAARTQESQLSEFFASFLVQGLKFVFWYDPAQGASLIVRVFVKSHLTLPTKRIFAIRAHYRIENET